MEAEKTDMDLLFARAKTLADSVSDLSPARAVGALEIALQIVKVSDNIKVDSLRTNTQLGFEGIMAGLPMEMISSMMHQHSGQGAASSTNQKLLEEALKD